MTADQHAPYQSQQTDTTPAVLTHLGGILFGFIPSLVVWLTQRDKNLELADHAREALNLQLTLLIGYVAAGVIGAFTGTPLAGLIWIIGIVFAVQSAIAASKGRLHRVKGILRFIR